MTMYCYMCPNRALGQSPPLVGLGPVFLEEADVKVYPCWEKSESEAGKWDLGVSCPRCRVVWVRPLPGGESSVTTHQGCILTP